MSTTSPVLENEVVTVTGSWLQMRQLLRLLGSKDVQKKATDLYALSDVEYFITQIIDGMTKAEHRHKYG